MVLGKKMGRDVKMNSSKLKGIIRGAKIERCTLQGTHLNLETRGLFNHFLSGDCGALNLSGFDKILAVDRTYTHKHLFWFVCFFFI